MIATIEQSRLFDTPLFLAASTLKLDALGAPRAGSRRSVPCGLALFETSVLLLLGLLSPRAGYGQTPAVAQASAPAARSATKPALPPSPQATPPPAAQQAEAVVPAPSKGEAEKAPAPATASVAKEATEGRFDVTPKQADLFVGWATRVTSHLPDLDASLPAPGEPEPEGAHANGLEIVADYTWKVGGFVHRWPSWVGFFFGYAHFPGGPRRAQSGVLEYGLRIKHTLFPIGKVHPFFAYGLGAVQVFVKDIKGRGIGHVTRGGFGVDVQLTQRLAWTLELVYRMQSLPAFGGGVRRDFHTASVLTGLAFDLPSKR